VHKIETKPVEYSKAILKIIEGNPLLSREELATSLAKTSSWLSERLGLLKLTEEIGKLVDSGEIKLSNAYALAKLPPEEQSDFVDRALTMPPQQFTPTVNARVYTNCER
jgi:ParB family chromosome partitioning protein